MFDDLIDVVPSHVVRPRLDHLLALMGDLGIFEHADHATPRRHLGYTTDDNARALVVFGDAAVPGSTVGAAFERCLRMVIAGRVPGGWRNRLACNGRWVGRGSDDCAGRALWGLGHASQRAPHPAWREMAARAFVAGAGFRSPHVRASVFAVLGAVEVLSDPVTSRAGESLLATSAGALPLPRPGTWRWPEDRLTYANARLPEALIAAGEALVSHSLLDAGLELLDWLVRWEEGTHGFSFTPVGGRGPADRRPGFDQQPIEAWAMADACARASKVTGEAQWGDRLTAAVAWLRGANDVGVPLYDPQTGAGHDGLTPWGVNRNQGAESTLSAVATLALLHPIEVR